MTYTNPSPLTTAVNGASICKTNVVSLSKNQKPMTSFNLDFSSVIDELPQRQRGADVSWRRTKISPCAILSWCTDCKQYLPITSFYTYNKQKKSRLDILNNRRASHCRDCANKRFLQTDPRSKLLNSAKQRAKLKGLEFNLTIDDVVIPEYCPVLGIKLKASVGEGRKNLDQLEHSPSLDRVDNTKGYTKNNVMVISLRANNIKKDATLKELKALVKYVEDFQSATTSPMEVLR